MAGSAARIERAAETHRRAAAIAAAAGFALAGWPPRPHCATTERSIRELAERLRAAAAQLAPGWLGAPLDAVPATTPLPSGDPPTGVATGPAVVRIGTGYPLDDASFPVVVPLGHLAFDGDARDVRVAGALQAVLLRLLAAAPAGSLLVRAVDPTGKVFAPFAPLHDAGILPPPATDRAGLRGVLGEAEQWVRGARTRPEPTRLLVVAAWPEATGSGELARLPALARAGPAAGLHLLVAGWPPPPLPAGPDPPSATAAPLPHTTQVRLRNPYAVVGHPPGESFGTAVPPGQSPSPGLNAQVFLDDPPPVDLVSRVCASLAASLCRAARVTLGELLPGDPLWAHDAEAGLEVAVGRSGDAPTVLRLGSATAHWLIVGRAGSGKTSLLLDLLYGLASRYRPDQLAAYLLDLTGQGSFADFVPSGNDPADLPHARAVLVEPSREEALAVLRLLVGRLARREQRPCRVPRLACLLDGADRLLAGTDPVATEATGLLRVLAERGGRLGVHLVLAGRTVPPEPVASRCRVRIALPGGADALDPANHSAASLALGTGVVNTAGGLGGPRGATRAHERLVRFPDPHADRTALAGLRHRLWRAGGGPG
jgi:hypothetical protein